MTEREARIIHAAKAWAKAERALRNMQDREERGSPRDPEEHRRIVAHCDYTEQVLIAVVEGPKPPRYRFYSDTARRTGRSWMFDEILQYVPPRAPRVGDEVVVYDRYRFAVPVLGVISKLAEVNDGVEVTLRTTNNPMIPVGSAIWVHARQVERRSA